MPNPVKAIHQWNITANLHDNNDRALESYMLLEEVFEGMGIPDPKDEAKSFMRILAARTDLVPVSEVEWLDHLTDLEFILHGSKCKMGLSPQQDTASIMAVIEANNQKLKAGRDAAGKQIKPDGFVGPESKLQKILSERRSNN